MPMPAACPGALERGRVTMADVDAAVRRILALKAALGLFDDPYRRGHGLTSEQLAAHRALAREAARRAIVLLTNRGGALPLVAGRRPHRGDRPARRRACRHAGAVGGRRPARGDGDHPGGTARGLPGPRGRARAGRRDRRRRHERHPGGARSRPRGRGRGALPRRGARDERRGGEPRAARLCPAARPSSRRRCSTSASPSS